jgi:hypothetical protein
MVHTDYEGSVLDSNQFCIEVRTQSCNSYSVFVLYVKIMFFGVYDFSLECQGVLGSVPFNYSQGFCLCIISYSLIVKALA